MSRRKLALAAAIVFGLPALPGCDSVVGRFELVRGGDQAYVLNKQTGDVRLLQGATSIVVKPLADQVQGLSASKARQWPPQAIEQLEAVSVSVRTTHRDGRLLYQVMAGPYKGRLEKEFLAAYSAAAFNVDLDDENGFSVATVRAAIKGSGAPTRIVDKTGEAMFLQWRGGVAMTEEAYASVSSATVGWAGFDKD